MYNILKMAFFICNTFALNNFKNFRNLGATDRDFVVAISSRVPSFSSCIAFGESCMLASSTIFLGRNPVPWGPANVQTIEYLILENGFRRSLTQYILHLTIVNEHILIRHDVVFFLVWILCSLPPLARQKCVLKCVRRLCLTLYNKIWDVVELCAFLTVVLYTYCRRLEVYVGMKGALNTSYC